MILTDVLREIFQTSDSLNLSYGSFLIFITMFITLSAGSFALVNMLVSRFLKR